MREELHQRITMIPKTTIIGAESFLEKVWHQSLIKLFYNLYNDGKSLSIYLSKQYIFK